MSSRTRIAHLLDRLQPSEDVVLIATALVIGVGVGIGAVIFSAFLDLIFEFGFERIPELTQTLGKAYVVFVPMFGGLIVGLLIYNVALEAKGHGVPEVMEAIAVRGGRIRPVVAIIKSIASAITIGTGGSAGRKAPMVLIGGSIGSTIGQKLHVSEDRMKNLVACGAAAGISATFSTPIAGVMFALEVILGELNVRYFSTVVIASVIADITTQLAFGDIPTFPLPLEYGVNSYWEYLFYILLALLAGVVSFLFVRVLYRSEDVFDHINFMPGWLKPAIGGGLLGIVALLYPPLSGIEWETVPHIFNVGYETINSTLTTKWLALSLIILMFLKIIATSLTLGSGGSGGVFAPSLFIGAMLGSAFGLIMESLFPGIPAPSGAYALLGMAGVFSASTFAPMTGMVIVFELTDDYQMILPLMLTVTVATMFARRLLANESIYTLKLTRRGIRLQQGRDIDLMQGVQVDEAMETPPPTVSGAISLLKLKETLREKQTRALCVLDDNDKLYGVVTLGDLQRAFEQHFGKDIDTLTALDICSTHPITVLDDDMLYTVVRIMGVRDIGYIPVLNSGTSELVGLVTRQSVMHAYNMATARKVRDQHKAEQMRLNQLTGAHVFTMRVQSHSPVLGKQIQDIAWPAECVVASIKRKGKLLVPHGYTRMESGDTLTIVAEPEAKHTIESIFKSDMVG